MAGRPIKKRTCAQLVKGRAMPENEIPPVRGDIIYYIFLYFAGVVPVRALKAFIK